MKKSFLSVVAALLLVGCGTSDKAPVNVINQEEVMAQMSLEDKAHFVICNRHWHAGLLRQ